MSAQIQTPQPQAAFQSASLYVGDLHNDVTEGVLFDLFNRVGPVASIRVCRDAVTRRSLGYAYVNFHDVQDAERSLDTMNFTDIKGRPCRIMWSQRDPSLRKSGVGNVFVKNLAPTVDNKGLFDTFSVFGNILSCKVAMDDAGVSKGYGYVHYETAEAAQDAIAKFNGNFIDELEVLVGPFVRRQERSTTVNWTNLYVKQFPVTWDEAKLKELFSTYGVVANVFLNKDAETGKSKGFGFVNYVEHEAADAALKELSGKKFPDPDAGEDATFELYVNKAQKRVERVREIKTKMDAIKEDKISKFQGMNLYVKNIDDSVTDEFFRETFAKYGTVTSARIMREGTDSVSKGFGFVCFSSSEEAQRAQTEMNNKMIRSKPITITLHQRKDVRRAQLAATYAPRNARFPQAGGQAAAPMPYMPMYMPQGAVAGGGAYPQQPGQQQARGAYGNYQGQGQQQQPYVPRGAPRGAVPYAGRGAAGNVPQQGYYPAGPVAAYAQPGMIAQQGVGAGGYVKQQRAPLTAGGQVGANGMVQQRPRQMNMSPTAAGGIPPQQQQGGYMTAGGYMQQQMVPPQMMNVNGQPQMVNVQQQRMVAGPGGVPVAAAGGIKFNSNVRNQGGVVMQQQGQLQPGQQQQMMQMQMQQQQQLTPLQQQQQMMQQQQPQQQQQVSAATMPVLGEPLDDQALAQADPQMQKNMIGEKLYPLIYVHQPGLAGKITGMLLEMDNAELLNLIESPEALQHKIDEALVVLKNHQQVPSEEQQQQ